MTRTRRTVTQLLTMVRDPRTPLVLSAHIAGRLGRHVDPFIEFRSDAWYPAGWPDLPILRCLHAVGEAVKAVRETPK